MAARAYYNDNDPDAVAILRHLVSENVLAPGDVDDRSIKDVRADDLDGYTQCHFFAGGGLWSVAARLAGWPDDRPLWSGSCPCQPFSKAGRQGGADDPRHLWPDFLRLIGARRPPVVVGEQVAGKAGRHWFHGVRSDLAARRYANRAVDIPACAVDSPQERSRLYWVGVDLDEAPGFLGDAGRAGLSASEREALLGTRRRVEGRTTQQSDGALPRRNGSYWSDATWIECRDGKARRAKPGAPLLDDGFPGRVGLWRVAGNAISPVLASEVIASLLDVEQAGAFFA